MSRQIVEDSRCLLLWHEAYSLVWFLCPAASVLRFLPVKVKGTKIRLNKSKLCGSYPCHVTLFLYENEVELSSSRFTRATEEKKWRKVDGPLEWGWGTKSTTTFVDFIHFASGTEPSGYLRIKCQFLRSEYLLTMKILPAERKEKRIINVLPCNRKS